MKEASLLKFYFVRYFFLALASLQAIAGLLVMIRFHDSPKNRFAIFVFFTLAMVLVSIHLLVFSKVKRVAVSKKKIVVIGNYKEKQYDWDEVKDLRLLPFINMYGLKLRNKKGRIYFLPAHDSEALFGLFSKDPEFVRGKISKA